MINLAQYLWLTGPVAPQHVGSSQTRARTRVPCIGRQTLNHCATREAPASLFKITHIFIQVASYFYCLKYRIKRMEGDLVIILDRVFPTFFFLSKEKNFPAKEAQQIKQELSFSPGGLGDYFFGASSPPCSWPGP